jgi:antiviral helicase SLH1
MAAIRKPHVVTTLYSTLSSSRPKDEISGDIAELVGFDDIEFAMEILENRGAIVERVSESAKSVSEDCQFHAAKLLGYVSGDTYVGGSSDPHLNGKSKQAGGKSHKVCFTPMHVFILPRQTANREWL